MSEPVWHEVIVDTRELLATLPRSICCNCGGTVGVEPRRIELYRLDPFRGASTHLHFTVPACAGCAPTLRARDPRLDGVAVHAVALAAGSAVLVLAFGAQLARSPLQLAGLAVVSAAVSVHLLWRWLRRAPRGARVTNYQPVRFLGNEGLIRDTYYLSFANPTYAALVSAHCGQPGPGQLPSAPAAALPAARVVHGGARDGDG